MPVIGIDQVPRELQRPSFWSDLGYAEGSLGRAILLAMIGGGGVGQVPTPPTPQRPGTLTFPSGAKTPTSPLEMAQIQARGGVPTQQGMTPLQPGGVTYQQPTRLGILPDLTRQNTQADIELKLRQAEYWKTLIGLGQTPQPQPPTPPKPPPQPTSPVLQGLWSQAQSGDQKAMDAIRLLAIEKDDPEAIAILQSLGEL